MPVFADNLSLMEKRYGENISLNNISQFRVIGPDGKIQEYRMEPAALDKALADVKWKYKDDGYDPKLRAAVDLLEWGKYADGMRTLKPFLVNPNKKVAESAKKLYDVLHAQGEQWITAAEGANQTENLVAAFDLYTKITTTFIGEDLAKKAADPLKKLAASKAVKDELAARQMYSQLCDGAGKARPGQRNAIAEFAARIAKKYPNTPTGEKAAEIAQELASAE